MYTTISNILKDAVKRKYAVVACSAINMEMARGIVSAASRANAPIIFLLGQNMLRQHAKAELLIPMIRTLAEYAPVPIATCLDHGNDPERILYSFRNGFSSIMYDGSLLPFEKNIENTKMVAEAVHSMGMGIEGELGHVGIAAACDGRDSSLYTDPADAERFAMETGVDCLAVAVGTAHGEYPKGYVPHISFERISEIRSRLPEMPLALHGGSGSGEENIIKAVEAGINKVNVVTDLFIAARNYLRDETASQPDIPYIELMSGMEKAVSLLAGKWISMTGSEGKADGIRPVNRIRTLESYEVIGLSE